MQWQLSWLAASVISLADNTGRLLLTQRMLTMGNCLTACPGYIIPQNVVKHFLEEYEAHGTFRGCCSVGFRWQDMENISLKEHFKVCMIAKLSSLCPAAGPAVELFTSACADLQPAVGWQSPHLP